MRRQVTWFVAALVFGVLGAAVASGLEGTTVVARLTAADHEVEEGYFSLGEGATVLARPGTDLHRWLASHRGQRVRLVIEAAKDGLTVEPGTRPGTGRDSGAVSLRVHPGGAR